ncbi:unnamed protein product, partial [marine sediment metagenome]
NFHSSWVFCSNRYGGFNLYSSSGNLQIFLDDIFEFCHLVEVNEKIIIIKDDPDDDKILECAISAKCDYIIYGDRHLIKLGSYKNIKILEPADFLFLVRK